MSYETNNYVIVDIEADGLLDTVEKIHCIVLRYPTGRTMVYHDGLPLSTKYTHDGHIHKGLSTLAWEAARGTTIVGHNIVGYDFPMIKKLAPKYFPFRPTSDLFKDRKVIDTYIAVSMLFPEERPGLEYWGRKLGKLKPSHTDWTKLSYEMIDRCIADCAINSKLLEYLYANNFGHKKWLEPMQLEQKVLWIHAHQVMHGMRIDVLRASELIDELDSKLDRLEKSLHVTLPKTVTVTGTEVKRPFLADGCLSKMSRDWFNDCGIMAVSNVLYPMKSYSWGELGRNVRVGGPFSRITFTNVNLNSHPKVKEILTNLGWKPTEWNWKKDKRGQFVRDADGKLIKTSPRLTEDSYDSLPPGLGQELKEYLVLKHRRRFLLNENRADKGLLSFVNKEGRVSCDAFTCGTNTARYRHSGAFVNLPSVSSLYGAEIRSVFCVPTNRYLIGIDLEGIEARMTGHYAWFYDGGDYIAKVLGDKKKGQDVHSNNARALGCDRETAKTFLYAISYGAGAAKMASILGCTTAQAKRKIKAFWSANKGIAKLIEALEAEYDAKGYITGIDGRELYIRHKHKLLNTLIQFAAAVVFKRWMVKCWEFTQSLDPAICQILAYHDELGWECYSYKVIHVKTGAAILADKAKIVGEEMKLNVPIAAEWKIGHKYSEVH